MNFFTSELLNFFKRALLQTSSLQWLYIAHGYMVQRSAISLFVFREIVAYVVEVAYRTISKNYFEDIV